MKLNQIRFAVAMLALLSLPALAQAQTVDMAGDWILTVTTDTGVTNPTLTLMQEGDALTGEYSSATLGTAKVRGTVREGTVTISFEADLQGQLIPVIYRGTVDDKGEWSGSLDIADGALMGSFTATKS
jgi:hypothetical protein